jgi:hypothetical protein
MSQLAFAAIAAVAGFAGLASAQSAAPNYYPVIPAYQPMQPAQALPYAPTYYGQQAYFQPIQSVQTLPASQQSTAPQTNPAPGAATTGSIGCSSCSQGIAGGYRAANTPSPYLPESTVRGAGLAPVPYNEFCPQCANGCGSLKSDLGFFFGSCKSFFNPCGPIPCNGLGGSGGCNKCGVYPYGKPYATPFNGCAYSSYQNH